MKWSWRTEWPQWLLLAVMFLLAALNWAGAPDRMPVHWGIDGRVDRYGSRFEGLLILPLLGVGLYLLMLVLPRLDPGRANYAAFQSAYHLVRTAVLATLAGAHALILWNTRTPGGGDVQRLVTLGLGVLFVLLGSVMGKLRPNWFVGVRTPWTLSSKVAWVRTHRLAGWLFLALGVAMLACGGLGARWALTAGLAGAILVSLGLAVYSYVAWRSDPDKTPPAGTLPA